MACIFGAHDAGAGAAPLNMNAVGDLEDIIERVRDDDDRQALITECLDKLQRSGGFLRAQSSSRFVHYEDAQVLVPNSPCDGHCLPLSA